jgi:hypothetical protein
MSQTNLKLQPRGMLFRSDARFTAAARFWSKSECELWEGKAGESSGMGAPTVLVNVEEPEK